MKTTIQKRLLRLGILCAGVMGSALAVAAAIGIIIIEDSSVDRIGNYIVNSTGSVMQEEVTFLSEGLETAAPGEENGIFEEVFMLGDTRPYDYSTFNTECSALEVGGTAFYHSTQGDVYLFAMKRSDGVYIGELEGEYFDAAMSGLVDKNEDYGFFVNKKGTAVFAINSDMEGKNLSEESLYSHNLSEFSAGNPTESGNFLSGKMVYSAPLSENSEYGIIYVTSYNDAHFLGTVIVIILVGFFILLLTIAIVISIKIAKEISGSIIPTTKCLDKFSHGVIDSSFVSNHRGDETEVLSVAMKETIDKLGLYIRDIDAVLNSLANGDLTVMSRCEYEGDFTNIKNSLDKIASSLKSTITTIRQAGEQVSGGAGMLSQGAQSLAANSSTEADTIQQLDTLVKSIKDNVESNAKMSLNMRLLSEQTIENVDTGNRDMNNLSTAISDIRKASEEIQSIAKIIDDIAFQTNILSLNAAVEAARAGEAGKGFAVVADEVRNLAGKSSEAAKNAVKVIQRCTEAVNQGVALNDSACRSLAEISTSIKSVGELIEKVSESSERQSKDIQVVNQGLGNITSVVQSNAATAEESAASSEELSSQAAILKEQLLNFNI